MMGWEISEGIYPSPLHFCIPEGDQSPVVSLSGRGLPVRSELTPVLQGGLPALAF